MNESSFSITKAQYDYLLPVLRPRLLVRTDRKVEKYYFIGTHEDHLDMLNRCKYIK